MLQLVEKWPVLIAIKQEEIKFIQERESKQV